MRSKLSVCLHTNVAKNKQGWSLHGIKLRTKTMQCDMVIVGMGPLANGSERVKGNNLGLIS